MAKTKTKRHRRIRWEIQIFFLFLFILLFGITRYSNPIKLQNLFFRFDPLIFVVVSIAYRTVITATLLSILIIITTLIFGRFFCGFICPLGTTIDILNPITRKKKTTQSSLKNGKYLILLFLLVSAIVGGSFLHFFDPLVILERSLTLVFYPIFTYIFGLFTALTNAVYTEFVIALVIFLTIIGLSSIAPRFWCRNLCPLGGLLAFLSKFSLFKFSFLENCKE